MAKEYSRALRVGELIHRELASLLLRDIKDPRTSKITIVDVKVSRDLSLARVYYTFVGLDDERILRDCESGLRSASGFLRRELGKRLKVRSVPQLRFVYDETQRQGDRIPE